jgi:beta-lactamase class A
MIGRRRLLGSGLAAGAAWALAGCRAEPQPDPDMLTGNGLFDDLVREFAGGLGVAAIHTGTGARIEHDAETRYAMCSTFKLPLAGQILAAVDAGRLSLDTPVAFGSDDMVPYAPVTERHLDRGSMTIGALCDAAVTMSDNVAANLLLRQVGGPAGFTQFLLGIGDRETRLDRIEPDLNENAPGDPRDTTTPRAMRDTVRRLALGEILSPASRTRLTGWMEACTTGRNRLRAGLPEGWRAGDKTGTSTNGASNDVAVFWPPESAPIVIACFIDAPDVTAERRDRGHAEVADRVVRHFLI